MAGYLRLRSPYNLCLDAALLVGASYVLGAVWRWLTIAQGWDTGQRTSAIWAVSDAGHVLAGLMFYVGEGVFLVACARIIADRGGETVNRG